MPENQNRDSPCFRICCVISLTFAFLIPGQSLFPQAQANQKKPGQSSISAISVNRITFSNSIAPLIYDRCAPCHHIGGIGPFPLTSYDEVRRHAAQIADVTRRRYMPPWPPQPGFGDFQNDRHLSPAQIDLISTWVKSGAPPGNAERQVPISTYPAGWQLGQPDLVLRMPQPFQLAASGPDLFRNFVIPNTLASSRYVRGFELKLTATRAVHHANIVLDRTRSLRKRDGIDGQPGFPGMDVITEAAADDFDPDSHFLFWKPATTLKFEDERRSWRLDTGTDLVLNLHLQPTGKPESVIAEIGLYFTSQPPTEFPMLVQLENDGALRIPPDNRDFTVTDRLTLPVDADLLAIYPHAHYLGKVIEAWATLPGGRRLPLIRIPDWDINWQATYEYRQPIRLPKGTEVAMRIVYDNSEANRRNPNHPPELVTAGNRSQDEMGHVWLQLLPVSNGRAAQADDPHWALQEAVMRRRLQKYPGDFLAEYNLGALLQSRGRLPDAETAYRAALRSEPGNATAHNSLGSLLLQRDQPAQALPEFEAAIAQNPDYFNAHFNLARVLGSFGKWSEAEREYRTVLRLQPDDAATEAALGILSFRKREFAESISHLRHAAQLDPANAEVQGNLGAALASVGQLEPAVEAFRAALAADPGNESARKNLAKAEAALHARH